jgi:hypothetical protein
MSWSERFIGGLGALIVGAVLYGVYQLVMWLSG